VKHGGEQTRVDLDFEPAAPAEDPDWLHHALRDLVPEADEA
jgi:hypothetical protein